MFAVLKQSYPYYNSVQKIPKNSLAILLAVFSFLYLFRPFDVNEAEQHYSYIIICLVHALNAALVYCLFFTMLNWLGASLVAEQQWKVYKSIVTTAVLFLLIGTGSFLLRPLIYSNEDNYSWHYLYKETFNTFLAGSLVFAGFTLVDFYRLLRKHRNYAAALDEQRKQRPVDPKEAVDAVSLLVENAPFEMDAATFLLPVQPVITSPFIFSRTEGLKNS